MTDIKTPELLDNERAERMKHYEKINEVVGLVDDLLIEKGFSFKEWLEVVNMIGERTQKTVEGMEVRELNNKFNELYG